MEGDAEKPIHPLNYFPADKRRSRWSTFRRIAYLTLAVGVGIAVFIDRSDLWLRCRRAYWLCECMHHVTPPGTVLIEDDPVKAAKLLATNPDYAQESSVMFNPFGPPTTEPYFQQTAVYWPRDYRGYAKTENATFFPFFWSPAIAFMGERISPAGNRRLVVVMCGDVDRYDFEFNPGGFSYVFEPTSILGIGPPKVTRNLTLVHDGAFIFLSLKPGVADPNDLSHFRIDYVYDDKPHNTGTFDIHLMDDDTLKVRAVDAPATQPN